MLHTTMPASRSPSCSSISTKSGSSGIACRIIAGERFLMLIRESDLGRGQSHGTGVYSRLCSKLPKKLTDRPTHSLHRKHTKALLKILQHIQNAPEWYPTPDRTSSMQLHDLLLSRRQLPGSSYAPQRVTHQPPAQACSVHVLSRSSSVSSSCVRRVCTIGRFWQALHRCTGHCSL